HNGGLMEACPGVGKSQGQSAPGRRGRRRWAPLSATFDATKWHWIDSKLSPGTDGLNRQFWLGLRKGLTADVLLARSIRQSHRRHMAFDAKSFPKVGKYRQSLPSSARHKKRCITFLKMLGNSLAAGSHVKLLVNVSHVRMHGVVTNGQRVRNFFVGVTFSKVIEHFAF